MAASSKRNWGKTLDNRLSNTAPRQREPWQQALRRFFFFCSCVEINTVEEVGGSVKFKRPYVDWTETKIQMYPVTWSWWNYQDVCIVERQLNASRRIIHHPCTSIVLVYCMELISLHRYEGNLLVINLICWPLPSSYWVINLSQKIGDVQGKVKCAWWRLDDCCFYYVHNPFCSVDLYFHEQC